MRHNFTPTLPPTHVPFLGSVHTHAGKWSEIVQTTAQVWLLADAAFSREGAWSSKKGKNEFGPSSILVLNVLTHA